MASTPGQFIELIQLSRKLSLSNIDLFKLALKSDLSATLIWLHLLKLQSKERER